METGLSWYPSPPLYSRELRSGSRDKIGPVNFAPLHLVALRVFTRCSIPADSKSVSRSRWVPAISAAQAAIAPCLAFLSCCRSHESTASRASGVAGTPRAPRCPWLRHWDNIHEAIGLDTEGEDLAERGFSGDPTILATMELEAVAR
ncbi:MAG: hypothetical protein ABSE42_18975 [Bryobacteraceae bacterium]|jgi:hypothetical protein